MRQWLRIGGLGLLTLALALDLALLTVGDPANLPGPLGQAASEHVIPWAQDAVLPWAVRIGLVQSVEAQEFTGDEPTPAAEVSAPTPIIEPTPDVVWVPLAHAPTPAPTIAPATVPTRAAAGQPGRIQAPGIGLDAPVVAVKVDASGAMGTPRTAGEVGWYGPRPGDPGNALLAGHVDWVVNGKPVKGSFYYLNKVNPGDTIAVRAEDGATRTFRVEWKRYYEAATAPVDEIAGPTTAPSITLITCGGPFDRSLRSYVGRWVVRAVLQM